MPTYLYKCIECEYEFEVTQRITEDALEYKRHHKRGGRRKSCGGKLKRLIAGSVAVMWKGGAPTSKTYV